MYQYKGYTVVISGLCYAYDDGKVVYVADTERELEELIDEN